MKRRGPCARYMKQGRPYDFIMRQREGLAESHWFPATWRPQPALVESGRSLGRLRPKTDKRRGKRFIYLWTRRGGYRLAMVTLLFGNAPYCTRP